MKKSLKRNFCASEVNGRVFLKHGIALAIVVWDLKGTSAVCLFPYIAWFSYEKYKLEIVATD